MNPSSPQRNEIFFPAYEEGASPVGVLKYRKPSSRNGPKGHRSRICICAAKVFMSKNNRGINLDLGGIRIHPNAKDSQVMHGVKTAHAG